MKIVCRKQLTPWDGEVTIQGSKNTVLPIMAATVLSSGVSVIYNCPMIEDVTVMCQLLEHLHIKTHLENNVLTIDTRKASYAPLPQSLTTKLRSSVLLLGPILSRWQKVELGVPGGCAIGLRPIDLHIWGIEKLSVDLCVQNEMIKGSTCGLQGTLLTLRFPSVGATENLLMASVMAKGITVIRGAAKEPEIIELCQYLISMGALIDGVGTDVLFVKGVCDLCSSDYCNVYDRIVAGTYLLAAAAIPGRIVLRGIEDIQYMRNIIDVAVRLGVNVIRKENVLYAQSVGNVQRGCFETGIYPDFPTDLLPVLIVVLLQAQGYSTIKETIFENRLGIVRELKKLGAACSVCGQTVSVEDGCILVGNNVCATDLRQGAALVIAGLLSEGETIVDHISYIYRGYEDIVKDLRCLGADIDYLFP